MKQSHNRKKTCIDCKQSLDVRRFYLIHKNSVARQSRCKKCDNIKRAGSGLRKRGPGRVDAVRRADGSIDLVRK